MRPPQPKGLAIAPPTLVRAAMKRVVAIMQPYWFPYIGYFQLISASDVFVLHDDVQYIKGGWVNRNRILFNGKDRMVTLPVEKGPHDSPINSRCYLDDGGKSRSRMLRLIDEAYAKAPQYRQVRPMIEELLAIADPNVASFNSQSIRRLCGYMGIVTPIVTSSELAKNNNLAGQERVIEICRRLDATDYLNPIGGMELYGEKAFKTAGITLHFLESLSERYLQFSDTWIPSLSVLDVLMFNSVDELRRLLGSYRLVSPREVEVSSATPRIGSEYRAPG
jgi:hypothetical protein